MKELLKLDKGYHMEEALRNYFLQSGYYVARGVPFRYEGFDVTDIDLWLYSRTSPVSREISIVDIKNKKTPQAFERIFWVRGLKIAIQASAAIVATADRRKEVKEFGRNLDVLVLDGAFLSRLQRLEDFTPCRLLQEEFTGLVQAYELEKLDGGWLKRLADCKSLLSSGLSFDSCNEWLYHAQFFLEQSFAKPQQRDIALRCYYLLCSFIALAADYILREVLFLELSDRMTVFTDGFTFGSRGSKGMHQVLDITMNLVEQHAERGKAIAGEVRSSVKSSLADMNSSVLAEYLVKNDVARNLFSVAKELEQMAMSREFVHHSTASAEARSLLFCLIDFYGFDRTQFA
jgi:hypothetical protein